MEFGPKGALDFGALRSLVGSLHDETNRPSPANRSCCQSNHQTLLHRDLQQCTGVYPAAKLKWKLRYGHTPRQEDEAEIPLGNERGVFKEGWPYANKKPAKENSKAAE